MNLRGLLVVGAGGAIGSVVRYLLTLWLGSVVDGGYPWGTLSANVSGSFLIGVVLGFVERGGFGTGMRLFLAVGLLGGFTTFSFFSYENLELLREDRFATVLINVIVQVSAGLLAAAAGHLAATKSYRR